MMPLMADRAKHGLNRIKGWSLYHVGIVPLKGCCPPERGLSPKVGQFNISCQR